ncbi:MAG: hypothetical protein QHH10_00110 [Peptococcaceae bacterium]|jgi:hypothetical protein|nr:hypothetical protein [Peptococcaceae bacterium]MDH7523707.1 hypothetical protein [Peptococcaceae bacterium]
MIENIEKCEMVLEKPGYPWQVVQGDGVTWLFLRRKKRIEEKRINGLDRFLLEQFSWDIPAKKEKEIIYTGNLALSVYFSAKEVSAEGIPLLEAEEDEHLCRELFAGCNKLSGKQNLPPLEFKDETSFPSILFDEIEEASNNQEISCGTGCWKIELPWRAGLAGEGEGTPPRLVKLHLAQVGLSTLLLEAAIKLETSPEPGNDHQPERKYLPVPRKKAIFQLKDEEIMEVLGITQQRGFYSTLVDAESQSVTIKNLLKTTAVFITSRKGGERFLAASHVCAEENKLPGFSTPEFPPISHSWRMDFLKTIKMNADKIICETGVMWFVNYESPKMSTKTKEVSAWTAKRLTEKAEQKDVIQKNRKKPGEKWMRKTASPQRDKTGDKLVIRIKTQNRK